MTQQKHWNEKLEKAAMNLRNSCLVYKWCHSKMSSRHSLFDKILQNVTTVLNVIVTTGIFTTFLYCSTNFEIQMIVGCISVCAGIIDRVHSNMSLEASSDDHKRISIRWGELYSTIDYQLRLDAKDRTDANHFIPLMQKLYMNLLEISPNISKVVWEDYRKQFPEVYQASFLEATELINTMDVQKPAKINKTTSKEEKEEYIMNQTKQFESNRMKYEIDRYLQNNVD